MAPVRPKPLPLRVFSCGPAMSGGRSDCILVSHPQQEVIIHSSTSTSHQQQQQLQPTTTHASNALTGPSSAIRQAPATLPSVSSPSRSDSSLPTLLSPAMFLPSEHHQGSPTRTPTAPTVQVSSLLPLPSQTWNLVPNSNHFPPKTHPHVCFLQPSC